LDLFASSKTYARLILALTMASALEAQITLTHADVRVNRASLLNSALVRRYINY
jgi:hypothetical protein